VFALLKERGGETEARGHITRIECQGAFEKCLGFREAALAEDGFRHVQKQRRIIRRQPQRIPERGWDER